jgi:cell division protein FtsW (lipid II flippase)
MEAHTLTVGELNAALHSTTVAVWMLATVVALAALLAAGARWRWWLRAALAVLLLVALAAHDALLLEVASQDAEESARVVASVWCPNTTEQRASGDTDTRRYAALTNDELDDAITRAQADARKELAMRYGLVVRADGTLAVPAR